MTTPDDMPRRPAVDAVATEDELRRWYWLRAELAAMARALGVSAAGSKHELTERVAAALAGRAPVPSLPRTRAPRATRPLDVSTVLPPGQRCTQELRAHLRDRIGPAFRFDAPMRARVAAGSVTIDGLVAHWFTTRGRAADPIAPQFEYNRFTREWRAAHPGGDRDALLRAWWEYRDAPRPVPGGADDVPAG